MALGRGVLAQAVLGPGASPPPLPDVPTERAHLGGQPGSLLLFRKLPGLPACEEDLPSGCRSLCGFLTRSPGPGLSPAFEVVQAWSPEPPARWVPRLPLCGQGSGGSERQRGLPSPRVPSGAKAVPSHVQTRPLLLGTALGARDGRASPYANTSVPPSSVGPRRRPQLDKSPECMRFLNAGRGCRTWVGWGRGRGVGTGMGRPCS